MDVRYLDFIGTHLARTPNAVFVAFDRSGALIEANRGFRTLTDRFGVESDPRRLFQVPAFDEIVRICDDSDGEAVELSITLGDPHGELFSLSCSIQSSDQEIVCIGEIDRDEMVRLNSQYEAMNNEIQELNRSLVKRDLLVRETNHRVKNNLLVLSSLIRLREESSGVTNGLGELMMQVDAIRLLHDQLSAPDAANFVQANAYISELLENVFALSDKNVRVETDVRLERLPARTAVTLGLLVNEIATNALKHSFVDTDGATFSAKLLEEEQAREDVLVLAHSGPPMPENVDLAEPQTLGMMLIKAFTEQLRGTAELQRTPQTTYTIRFPAVAAG